MKTIFFDERGRVTQDSEKAFAKKVITTDFREIYYICTDPTGEPINPFFEDTQRKKINSTYTSWNKWKKVQVGIFTSYLMFLETKIQSYYLSTRRGLI